MAFLNYENKRASGKKLKVHFDLPEDDDYPNAIQRNSTTSISSDSSSLESDDTEKDDNSIDNIEASLAKYDGYVYGSPVWSFQSVSVTQSPPSQMMSPLGYDPNRIPSSVFAKSASPVEWSVASNESLFSLHLGNNSFSRDLAFTFNKSGELPRTSDFGSMPMVLPPVQEVNHDKHVEMERHSAPSDSASEAANFGVKDGHENAVQTSAQVETTVLDKTPEDHHSKEATVTSEEAKNYACISYRSMESDISVRSFQFPILIADGGRSSSANGGRYSYSTGGRTSSSTVESEKQEKTENHQEEKPLTSPNPEAKTAPKQGGRSWCCCFCRSPCY